MSDLVLASRDLPAGYVLHPDGRVVRDVDALSLSFGTTDRVEAARTAAREVDRAQVLTRLRHIIRTRGSIISRHKKLTEKAGQNRPPFFYWGRMRREFDGIVPWWVTTARADSFDNLNFLLEHGTVENILRLLKTLEISQREVNTFLRRTPLRQEVIIRFQKAIALFLGDSVDQGDPVQCLEDAVRLPDHWCRPRVASMIREAAEEGPTGTLAALFPQVMDARLLDMLWKANLVSDELHSALLSLKDPSDTGRILAIGGAALTVDTGELHAVLEQGASQTVGAG